MLFEKRKLLDKVPIISQFSCQQDTANRQYDKNLVLENFLKPNTFLPYKK